MIKECVCERCGEPAGLGWTEVANRTNMIGGISATLCYPCIRDWNTNDGALAICDEINLAYYLRLAAVNASAMLPLEACDPLIKERHVTECAAHARARAMSLQWLATPPVAPPSEAK